MELVSEQLAKTGFYEQADDKVLRLLLLADLTEKIISITEEGDNTQFDLYDIVRSEMNDPSFDSIKDTKSYRITKELREEVIKRESELAGRSPTWMDEVDKWMMIVRPLVVDAVDSFAVTKSEVVGNLRHHSTKAVIGDVVILNESSGRLDDKKSVAVKKCVIRGIKTASGFPNNNLGSLQRLISALTIFDIYSIINEPVRS